MISANRGSRTRTRDRKRRRAAPNVIPVSMDFLSPASFGFPDYLADSAWIEHAPFAFWLIEAHRPRTLVELGAHYGFSFFAFCQAIQNFGVDATCFAVDTWKGDCHAGFYGEEVFDRVCDYNDSHYSAFARLVRSTFDEAVAHFEDSSIDLLHIDGRHYYEDVRHDFETWVPKLSDRAIVLLHDINVREREFGVFQLWSELRGDFPHFGFSHGHGLGVIGVGRQIDDRLRRFFVASSNEAMSVRIRQAYARLGSGVSSQRTSIEKNEQLAARERRVAVLEAQSMELQRAVETKSAELGLREEQLGAARAKTAELEKATEELQRVIAAKSGELNLREEELGAAHAKAAELERALEAQSGDLHRLNDDLEAAQNELAILRTKIADLEATLVSNSADTARLNIELTGAQRRIMELTSALEAHTKELGLIRASLSWQLTRPLRWIIQKYPWFADRKI